MANTTWLDYTECWEGESIADRTLNDNEGGNIFGLFEMAQPFGLEGIIVGKY